MLPLNPNLKKVSLGVFLIMGASYGKANGVLAARVLRAENPADIPFQEVAEQKLIINQQVASKLGIVFPPDVLKAAQGD